MVATAKSKKTLKIVGNIVFWAVLLLVLGYSVVSLLSTQDSNKITLFGYETLAVKSTSMAPTFNKGDMIVISTDFVVDDLEVGDVITYRMQMEDENGDWVTVYNTHRIYEIDGIWFRTKGDNINNPDPTAITGNDVVGVWTGARLLGLGAFALFLKSSVGFFLFIVLPCFGFLVYEVIRFVKIISEYNVQKALGDRVKMQEEAMIAAKAQLEAEMRAKIEAEKKPE